MMDEMPQTVQEAYAEAEATGKSPICPYCGKLLKVRQKQFVTLTWTWEEERQRFLKSEDGEADVPYCVNCEVSDWDFVDEKLVNY